jgi:hypothetical protein
MITEVAALGGGGLRGKFDLNKDAPQFSIRVRAQRFSPDMFYANEFADRLKQHNPEMFRELFR